MDSISLRDIFRISNKQNAYIKMYVLSNSENNFVNWLSLYLNYQRKKIKSFFLL